MASSTKALSATSSKQDLYDIIHSLTQQLELSDQALMERETQHRTKVSALELQVSTLHGEKTSLLEEKNKLITQLSKAKSEREEVEHRLNMTTQSLQTTQRELKQAQDSLTLANRHHASSLAQARQETESWKEQARTNLENVSGRLQSQSQQIDGLVTALSEHMANQPQQPTFILPPNESVFGPLITVPAGPRVKEEEADDMEEDDGGESEEETAAGPSRVPTHADRANPPKGRERTHREYRYDDTEYTAAEDEDDEDDEMAIGYNERHLNSSPTKRGQASSSRTHHRSSSNRRRVVDTYASLPGHNHRPLTPTTTPMKVRGQSGLQHPVSLKRRKAP